jgi:hypothetical protein
MPCSDSGPSREEIERESRDHQTMTRLSCDRCREIESRGGTVPSWGQEWWQEHKLRDAERLKRDHKVQREAEIRKQAIAKLTPEEREELGV